MLSHSASDDHLPLHSDNAFFPDTFGSAHTDPPVPVLRTPAGSVLEILLCETAVPVPAGQSVPVLSPAHLQY